MPRDNCPVETILQLIARRWTSHIFCQMLDKAQLSFSDLLNNIRSSCGTSISPSVLSSTLKDLEEAEIVHKVVLGHYRPPKTEYSLTEKGKELVSIYEQLRRWVGRWQAFNTGVDPFTCPINLFEKER